MFTVDDFILCFLSRTQDSTIATVADETPYGGVNQARTATANYFEVAKMSESQALTYITGIDNSDPLNSIEWSFTNTIDGAYRAFLFVTPLWDDVTNYVVQVEAGGVVSVYGNIVFHNGVWYKANADNLDVEPGVDAGWENSWDVFDEATFSTEINNDTIIVKIHDDIITFRYEDCLIEVVDENKDEVLCGHCSKFEDLFNVLKMEFMLDAANSSNWQSKAYEAEVTITEATKKFCC